MDDLVFVMSMGFLLSKTAANIMTIVPTFLAI